MYQPIHNRISIKYFINFLSDFIIKVPIIVTYFVNNIIISI